MKWLPGLIVSLFCSSALFAQTATLRGIVTDESGAIVPGAKITLTASARTATTALAGDDGSYSFTGIAPGDYVAEASAHASAGDSDIESSVESCFGGAAGDGRGPRGRCYSRTCE